MKLRNWRWYGVYGLVIGLCVVGAWLLLEPWRWNTGYVVGLLVWQVGAALVGSALHEGLHLREALRLGAAGDGVKAGWWRFQVVKPLEAGVYRRVMLAPLLLPLVFGGLVGVFDVRLGALTTLVWLLGSADDLADWAVLWSRCGLVTNWSGEGLVIYTTESGD